jgi:hypothetical protein
MSLLPSQKTAAAMAIKRMGTSCFISAPSESTTTDGYGKTADQTWNTVSEEHVVRIYTRGGDPQQSRTRGGRYRTESPVLLFTADSAVQEGFRVTYREAVYEIDSLTFYPTHIEADTTSVN